MFQTYFHDFGWTKAVRKECSGPSSNSTKCHVCHGNDHLDLWTEAQVRWFSRGVAWELEGGRMATGYWCSCICNHRWWLQMTAIPQGSLWRLSIQGFFSRSVKFYGWTNISYGFRSLGIFHSCPFHGIRSSLWSNHHMPWPNANHLLKQGRWFLVAHNRNLQCRGLNIFCPSFLKIVGARASSTG